MKQLFIFNSDPKKSFKNINDILKAIGIQNFVTINQSVSENQLKWSIKVQTAAAINPLRLSQELQNTNCRVVDIKKRVTINGVIILTQKNLLFIKLKIWLQRLVCH